MPTANELEVLRFGSDLVLPEAGETVRPTPSGDWPGLSGRDNLRAAILARAGTSPGELVHRPTYGAGVEDFVESISSPVKRAELVVALRDNLGRDPRVLEVAARVAVPAQGETHVTLEVQPAGAQDQDRERIEFTLE